MSKLYITEHRRLTRSADGHIMQIPGDYGVDQIIDFSGGAAASTAFAATTQFIRVNTDAVCSIAFGSAPTATTSNRRLSAGQTEFFPVFGGDKLSAISNT